MSTMEKLSKVYALDHRIRLEQEAAASMAGDAEISKMLSFLDELDSLASQYQFQSVDIVRLIKPDYPMPKELSRACDQLANGSLDPEDNRKASAPRLSKATGKQGQGGRRSPRVPKRYQNPHTGEFIETASANHKLLKKWKSDYGADEVETWRL